MIVFLVTGVVVSDLTLSLGFALRFARRTVRASRRRRRIADLLG